MIVDRHGSPFPATTMSINPEAASTAPRLSSWGLGMGGPNGSFVGSLDLVRSRSRKVVSDNAVASGGVDATVANLVGTDISPRWKLDDDGLKRDLQQLWSDSQQEIDYDGLSDFYGQEDLVARSMITAGEVLARPRELRKSSSMLVPFQIQLLEPDHLDAAHNEILPNGNKIRHGIEWNRSGRRVAYHLYREHPSEMYASFNSFDKARVRASDVAHVFRPLRPGQSRGWPWLGNTLVRLYELDGYDDAELVRKKTAALFAGIIESSAPVIRPGQPGTTTTTTPAGFNNVALEPGATLRLAPGETWQTSAPADVGTTYPAFMRQQLLFIARGLGITYEQLTGDLSDVNFSSIRAGLIEIRRFLEAVQLRTLIHQFCRPMIYRWLNAAVMANAIAIKDYWANPRKYRRIQWLPDAWEYVDPVKDRLAEQMDVRNGFNSRQAIVARRSRDIEEVDAEIVEDNARADKSGLIYDSDPRHTEKSGAIQQAEDLTVKESITSHEP